MANTDNSLKNFSEMVAREIRVKREFVCFSKLEVSCLSLRRLNQKREIRYEINGGREGLLESCTCVGKMMNFKPQIVKSMDSSSLATVLN